MTSRRRRVSIAAALLVVVASGCGTARNAGPERVSRGPRAPGAVLRCLRSGPGVEAVSDHAQSKQQFGFERQIAHRRAAIGVTLASNQPTATMGGDQRLELLFTRDASSARRLREYLLNLVAGYGGGIPPGYGGVDYPMAPTLITTEGPVVEAFLGLSPDAAQRRLASRCLRPLADPTADPEQTAPS